MHIYKLFVLKLVAMWLAKSNFCDYHDAMLGYVKKKAYDPHEPYNGHRWVMIFL